MKYVNNIFNKNFPIYILLLGYLLIQIGKPFSVFALVSLGTWIIFFSSILAFIINWKHNEKNGKLLIRLLFVIFFCGFIPLIRMSHMSYFTAIISFLELPLLLFAYSSNDDEKVVSTIMVCNFALSAFYIALSFSRMAYFHTNKYGVSMLTELTLGYNNPNELAMYLFSCVVLLSYWLGSGKCQKISLILYADIFYLSYLVFLTKSRNGMLALAFYASLVLIFRKRRLNRKIVPLCVGFGLLFCVFEMLFQNVIDSMSLMGESFETGRYNIYSKALYALDIISVFVGNNSVQPFQNLHNIYVTILAAAGIAGLTSFLIYIDGIVKYRLSVNLSGERIYALVGFSGFLIMSAAESAFFSAGSSYTAMVYLTFYLILSRQKDDSVAD